jgi:MATE family multidrug resistance protein
MTTNFDKPRPSALLSMRHETIALLRLGLPVIGSQLAQIAMNFVDTVMAGNLGARALAAIAVGGSLWMTVAIFIMGTMMAVTASVAHLFGAQKKREVGQFVRQALWVSQGLALICFLLVRNADPILYWLEIDPEIIPITLGYVDAISWGLPALCGFIVLRYSSEGVSMTRPAVFIGLIGLVVNILGNYVFMYGRLGVPAMGAVGCGWASALVMWIMFLSMTVYISIQKHYRQFAIFDRFDWPQIAQIRGIIKLGLPIGISVFLEASLFATVSLLMGSMGTNVVAGHQVAINIASISFMIPLGLSMAITVRVGQAVGRGSMLAARRAGFVGVSIALVFMGAAAIVLLLIPETIVGVYTNDARVTSIAVELLFMAAIFQLSDGAQVAGAGALRGLKDTTVPMIITFIAYWGIGLPLGYTLGITRSMGPQAIWIGLIGGLTVAAICLNVRFYFVTRRLLTEASSLG